MTTSQELNEQFLPTYREFARKWLGHTNADLRISDADNNYNDEYYEGAGVRISIYDNNIGREFMDYDQQCNRYEAGECVHCGVGVVEVEDLFCRKCGKELQAPIWQDADPSDYFYALEQLPFFWNGQRTVISLKEPMEVK